MKIIHWIFNLIAPLFSSDIHEPIQETVVTEKDDGHIEIPYVSRPELRKTLEDPTASLQEKLKLIQEERDRMLDFVLKRYDDDSPARILRVTDLSIE